MDYVPAPIHIDPATHTTPDGDDGWFYESAGGNHTYFKYNDYSSCIEAYNRCPPVQAIINRKAQAMINGKTWVQNTKGKEATSADAVKIRRLLDQPNPIQSGKQFEAQLYIYYQMFGFAIVFPIRPFGFDPVDTKSMWNIPVNWVDWDQTMENFTRAGGVALKVIYVRFNGGQAIPINLDELLIVRDFTPSFKTLTFPASKIHAMSLPINNIIGALESRGQLINFRGARGIISTNSGRGSYVPTPLTKKQKRRFTARLSSLWITSWSIPNDDDQC